MVQGGDFVNVSFFVQHEDVLETTFVATEGRTSTSCFPPDKMQWFFRVMALA